jgi:hypothetical protein
LVAVGYNRTVSPYYLSPVMQMDAPLRRSFVVDLSAGLSKNETGCVQQGFDI